jgi:nucleoside-diphosphate-sugar epimerase
LGGTGFIGSALVRYLSQESTNRLHLLIHKTTPYLRLENFNTISGSLGSIDPFWLKRYPPDVVFHLARPAGRFAITRSLAAMQGEIANRRLVKILASLPQPPVVVYMSGSLMYGSRPPDEPAREGSPLAPDSFARYYFRNEKPWLEARQSAELDVRFARPGWIAGPGSWFREFFWKHWNATGSVPCYGDGRQLMSLIHLEDCARMASALWQYGQPGQNLNMLAGSPLPQEEFSEIMAQILQAEVEKISFERIRKQQGLTVARALTSSIPMTTIYPGIREKAGIRYKDPRVLLADALRLLENEQGILA